MNLNFMKLREQMENQKVSYYLVPSEDPHQSEYVDDYFKSHAISGREDKKNALASSSFIFSLTRASFESVCSPLYLIS